MSRVDENYNGSNTRDTIWTFMLTGILQNGDSLQAENVSSWLYVQMNQVFRYQLRNGLLRLMHFLGLLQVVTI
jgi:hypothetical protein